MSEWVSTMDRAANWCARRWGWSKAERLDSLEAAQLKLCESLARGLRLREDGSVFALCVSYLRTARSRRNIARIRASAARERFVEGMMELPVGSCEPGPDAHRMAMVFEAINTGVRELSACTRTGKPRRLNAREKICWLMTDILGMEPGEAAGALGLTVGTVRTSAWEVRRVVRKELGNV